MEYQNNFFVKCVLCLQAAFQLSGPVCKSPFFMLLVFISCFVIDFLSIRKVIIFSAIANNDCHPLRSITKCCCLHGDDPFKLYCATGLRYIPNAHAHVVTRDPLPVIQTACEVRT